MLRALTTLPGLLRRQLSRAQADGDSVAGDRAAHALCLAAGLLVVLTLGDLGYELIRNAGPSISRFGLGFLVHQDWQPNFQRFGAASLIFGTALSSGLALLIAAPLGIGIGLYLSMLAPAGVRAPVGALVEMLAAVPSVIYGFWGVLVLAPFVASVEPALHSAFGFIPLIGRPQTTGISVFTAGIVLALMILPIISALSRDLFLTVPRELQEGAEALGATRWEVIRGVVLPGTASGVSAAMVLALGRALGEAIAVSLVIGDTSGIHASLFAPGATLAERIAIQFPSPDNPLHVASMFYAGVVLLVIGLGSTLAARAIGSRFDMARSYARAVTA